MRPKNVKCQHPEDARYDPSEQMRPLGTSREEEGCGAICGANKLYHCFCLCCCSLFLVLVIKLEPKEGLGSGAVLVSDYLCYLLLLLLVIKLVPAQEEGCGTGAVERI